MSGSERPAAREGGHRRRSGERRDALGGERAVGCARLALVLSGMYINNEPENQQRLNHLGRACACPAYPSANGVRCSGCPTTTTGARRRTGRRCLLSCAPTHYINTHSQEAASTRADEGREHGAEEGPGAVCA